MGSFWGLSKAGKEAEGYPREYGAWTFQQFKDWLARQNEAYDLGNWATKYILDYNLRRMNEGLGTPQDIRAWGQQVMPGVDDYITSQAGRLGRIRSDFSSLPSAAQTMGEVRGTISDLDALARSMQGQTDTEIRDTAQRALDRELGAHSTIERDILDRYDQLRRQGRDVYGTLRQELEQLRPSSEFAQARAARSFAPAVAETADRLRRAGIYGPQAVSAMQRVEAARSRAMDDAAAEGIEKYLDARRELGLSELDRDTGLSREQGELYRGETVRSTGAQQGIDRDRSERALRALEQYYDRMADVLDARSRAALLERGIQQQDWQTRSDLEREAGAQEREALGLRRDEFGAGLDYRTRDLAERSAAAAGVQDFGRMNLDYATRAANQALAFGDTARGAYSTAYGYEAPKAGWGLRLLGGMAGGALSAIPGVGPALGSLVGTAGSTIGALQGGYPAGGYYSGGYPAGGYYSGGYSSYGAPYYGTPPFLPQQTGARAAGGSANPWSALTAFGSLFKRSKNYDPNAEMLAVYSSR